MENPSPSSTNRKRARELGASATTKPEEVLKVERERRKKMAQMFTHLASTVPSLLPTVKIILSFFFFIVEFFNVEF